MDEEKKLKELEELKKFVGHDAVSLATVEELSCGREEVPQDEPCTVYRRDD